MTIENHESIGGDERQSSGPAEEAGSKKQLRGRKPAYESRAAEFLRELIIWKQTPISLRPTLRELADKLGTSHQMLSYYLDGLPTWQAYERAKRLRAEGRPFAARLVEAMADNIEELRRAAKRGPLRSDQFKFLKALAKPGLPGAQSAQEILARCRQMTLDEEKQARAFERKAMFTSAALKTIERIKQEAERGPLPWRDIEILKILARRKCAEAKELLRKYSKSALPRPQVPQ